MQFIFYSAGPSCKPLLLLMPMPPLPFLLQALFRGAPKRASILVPDSMLLAVDSTSLTSAGSQREVGTGDGTNFVFLHCRMFRQVQATNKPIMMPQDTPASAMPMATGKPPPNSSARVINGIGFCLASPSSLLADALLCPCSDPSVCMLCILPPRLCMCNGKGIVVLLVFVTVNELVVGIVVVLVVVVVGGSTVCVCVDVVVEDVKTVSVDVIEVDVVDTVVTLVVVQVVVGGGVLSQIAVV